MKKYSIGDIVGANNALLIISEFKSDDKKSQKRYVVECQICKKDSELHGEANYEVSSQYLSSAKLPCGCSKSPKRSEEQWKVIIQRKAKENNHKFLGFTDLIYKDQNSKLNLFCQDCGNYWSSCSVSNYIRDRACPLCAKTIRATKRATSDKDWIFRFRETLQFPEDKFEFTRVSETGRLWNVICKDCGTDKIFKSDRSNLSVGKVPCNCISGGGFDVNKTGYFYVIKVEIDNVEFVKYGISNFYKRRLSDHSRSLEKVNGKVLSVEVYTGDGKLVLSIESELKRIIPRKSYPIEGFRREACELEYYTEIIKALHFANLQVEVTK